MTGATTGGGDEAPSAAQKIFPERSNVGPHVTEASLYICDHARPIREREERRGVVQVEMTATGQFQQDQVARSGHGDRDAQYGHPLSTIHNLLLPHYRRVDWTNARYCVASRWQDPEIAPGSMYSRASGPKLKTR